MTYYFLYQLSDFVVLAYSTSTFDPYEVTLFGEISRTTTDEEITWLDTYPSRNYVISGELIFYSVPNTLPDDLITNITNTGASMVEVQRGLALLLNQQGYGRDVASSSTITLGLTGNIFNITGDTTIQGIDSARWNAGDRFTLVFSEELTVTHDGSTRSGGGAILLHGSTDYTSRVGGSLQVYFNGTNFIASPLMTP